jgi:hypothetical protein
MKGNDESFCHFGNYCMETKKAEKTPFSNMIQLQMIRWTMKYKFVQLYYYIDLKNA